MKPLVDIVIPTFNQPELTRKCFESIARSGVQNKVRLIWVDNGSETWPLILEALASTGLHSQQFLLGENLGFVKATNLGMAASTAPFVLLLNNDTELWPGWLEKFLDTMDRHNDVGIVGPWATPAQTQWQSVRPRSQLRGTWQGQTYLLEPERMLGFFCALIRRAVILDIGYLSEEWGPGWGDDDDYCARAQLAGWQLAGRDDVEVLHHGGATFNAAYAPEEWSKIRTANLERLRKKWPQFDPRARQR